MGRLIDADVLHGELFEYGCHKSKMHPMDVMKMIDEQPTAYDVEKVVEEIKKSATDDDGLIVKDGAEPMIWKSKAVTIIRNGGIRNE